MGKNSKSAALSHDLRTTSELASKVRTLEFAVFEARLAELFAGDKPLEWARKHGFSKTTVSNFLSRRNIPKAELLAQIAWQENVSVDWLLGLSEHRGAPPAPALDIELLAQVLVATAERAAALQITLAPRKHTEIVAFVYQQALAGIPLDLFTIDRLLRLAA